MALEGPGRWRVSFLPYAVAVWLLLIGLYGVVTSRHLVHLIVCLTVVQSSSYVLLLAIGYRTGAEAPIYKDIPPEMPVVDPVVQALTLTDVVVEATVAALLLALAVQAQKRFGTVDPDDIGTLKG
jgi:multicomponent Na+:H+ antiporter subunit C